MSSTTQPATFLELRNDLLNRARDITTAGSTAQTLAARYINTALYDMHISPGGFFPWAERRSVLITHAPYTTGTVSIAAAARTTVTGLTTLWNTAVTGFGFNNARVGGKMKFAGLTDIYNVSAVTNDTSITLASTYTGDALSGATYTYFEDEYSLASDFLRPIDARMFSTDMNIPFIGRQEFRRQYPRNDRPGKPRVATLIQIGFLSSTTPQKRIVLCPYPDDEYSIPYAYLTSNLAVTAAGTEQAQLVNDTDEPIVPLHYRHILVIRALATWYRDRKDDERFQACETEYVSLLGRMLGDTTIGQDRPQFIIRRRGSMPARGRFDINDWFDLLRW